MNKLHKHAKEIMKYDDTKGVLILQITEEGVHTSNTGLAIDILNCLVAVLRAHWKTLDIEKLVKEAKIFEKINELSSCMDSMEKDWRNDNDK